MDKYETGLMACGHTLQGLGGAGSMLSVPNHMAWFMSLQVGCGPNLVPHRMYFVEMLLLGKH